MPDENPIKPWMSEFLTRPLLARLATADPASGQPHVVPVWFAWDGSSVWISSYRSTRKIRDLEKNKRVSIVVDTAAENTENMAVIFEGEVELVTEPRDWLEKQISWVYEKYLGAKGVLAKDPQEWIHSPENLLINLTPKKIYSWKG
jgi:PPOX class probable F420-dependent enzyme